MLIGLVKRWLSRRAPQAAPAPASEGAKLARSAMRVRSTTALQAGARRQSLTPAGAELPRAETAFRLPDVPPGVVPPGAKLALDSSMDGTYPWALQSAVSEGLAFPGYPYLSELCQRAEYRRPSEILAQAMTRKWIKLVATGDKEDQQTEPQDLADPLQPNATDDLEDAADSKADKLRVIELELKRLNAQEIFKQALTHDGLFGRAQIFINCGDAESDELRTPMSVSASKIVRGSLKGLKVVEPIWTYPQNYNTSNPLKDDFYRPSAWFVMGKEVHASRLLTIVSRPVPDLLKPAYVFGGLSLSQLAKPYVDNWLRTRQSVSDLLASFNVFVLKTNMSGVLEDSTDPRDEDSFFHRLDLFNRTRDNRGVLALDKDTEEFQSISASLAGLDHLQAQAQEHQAAVTGIPLVVLLGITPSGLNAGSDAENKAFDDWINSQQESHVRPALEKLIDVVQLSMFGEIDPEIGFEFVPSGDKNESAQATIRKTDADTAKVYIDAGVIDPHEERERLAKEEGSLYAGLDLTKVIEPPAQDPGQELGGIPGQELVQPMAGVQAANDPQQ